MPCIWRHSLYCQPPRVIPCRNRCKCRYLCNWWHLCNWRYLYPCNWWYLNLGKFDGICVIDGACTCVKDDTRTFVIDGTCVIDGNCEIDGTCVIQGICTCVIKGICAYVIDGTCVMVAGISCCILTAAQPPVQVGGWRGWGSGRARAGAASWALLRLALVGGRIQGAQGRLLALLPRCPRFSSDGRLGWLYDEWRCRRCRGGCDIKIVKDKIKYSICKR